MEEIVINNETANRFELQINGFFAFVSYRLDERKITLTHTEVPPELAGQGIGGEVVKASLDFAKEKGLLVVPECPFVIRYIERHENYQDLTVK